ncbi:hypothetical protein ABZ863_09095 [Saccharomonospora sp. NPDC046836]|uniref:hypothetical protein n=1 Tax=Saccharomonospora sp. NPDC046836 TaxID=3156921 RepID=UPI0033D188E4
MTRRRSWFWPHSALIVVLPATAILAVVVGATWPMLAWPYPRWVETSAQWHQQFMWAGIIAGTASCLWAVRLNRADRVWAQPRSPRLGAAVAGRHLAVLGGWFVGAYVVALLPLTIGTALRGGVGLPDVLVMLSGVLAMTAAVALGYALGTLAPSLITVPVIGIALFALYVIGAVEADAYAAVTPVLYIEPMLGQVESTPFAVFRVLLFAAVTVAAAGLAAKLLQRQSAGTHRSLGGRAGDVGLFAVVPAALVVLGLSNQVALFTVEGDLPRACRIASGIEYCVHAADAEQLAAVVAAFDPIVQRFGTKPEAIDAVWARTLLMDRPVNVLPVNGVLEMKVDASGTIDVAYAAFAEGLVGLYTCADAQEGAENWTMVEAQHALADYLTHGGAPSGAFAGMSEEEVRAWIARNQDDLLSCQLDESDLPRA